MPRRPRSDSSHPVSPRTTRARRRLLSPSPPPARALSRSPPVLARNPPLSESLVEVDGGQVGYVPSPPTSPQPSTSQQSLPSAQDSLPPAVASALQRQDSRCATLERLFAQQSSQLQELTRLLTNQQSPAPAGGAVAGPANPNTVLPVTSSAGQPMLPPSTPTAARGPAQPPAVYRGQEGLPLPPATPGGCPSLLCRPPPEFYRGRSLR